MNFFEAYHGIEVTIEPKSIYLDVRRFTTFLPSICLHVVESKRAF